MRRRSIIIIILIFAAIAALYYVPSHYIKRKIEQMVAQRLPSTIGPAQSYTVCAYGNLFDLVSGKIDGIQIEGKGVRPHGCIRLDALKVEVNNVQVNIANQSISNIGTALIDARFAQKDFNALLTQAHPNVPGLSVVLAEGKMNLSAQPEIRGHSLPVNAEGTLSITDGQKLNVDITSLSAEGFNAPASIQRLVEERLNPQFDITKLSSDVRLTSVKITDGAIMLQGVARPEMLKSR